MSRCFSAAPSGCSRFPTRHTTRRGTKQLQTRSLHGWVRYGDLLRENGVRARLRREGPVQPGLRRRMISAVYVPAPIDVRARPPPQSAECAGRIDARSPADVVERLLISGGFYSAIQRRDVDLVSNPAAPIPHPMYAHEGPPIVTPTAASAQRVRRVIALPAPQASTPQPPPTTSCARRRPDRRARPHPQEAGRKTGPRGQ